MPDIRSIVEDALQQVLGRVAPVTSLRELGGGDISRVVRVQTNAGTFIVKSHPAPPPGFFAAEAAGLTALRESGTSLRIPKVVALREDAAALLVLEDLGGGSPARGFDEAFGRGLAELHRQTAPRFGFDRDTYCGTTIQPNAWRDSWVNFYAEARLGHQLELARRSNRLSSSEGERIGRLIDRLDTIIGEPPEGPALVHGDLWSGNLHVSDTGAPALIDPSAYYAHREAELGMMTLFGGFSATAYAAYEEAFPLEPGWRARNPVYQLYHLLNHLNLFGGGYRSQVMSVASRFA